MSTVQKRPLQPAPTSGADFFNEESSVNKAEAREEKLISRAAARNAKAEIKKKLRTAKSANRQKAEGEWLKNFSNYAGTHLPIVHRVPQWLSRVDITHKIVERGGYYGCVKCGGLAAWKPQKLTQRCQAEGSLSDLKNLIRKARRPGSAEAWPDGWAKDHPPPLRRLRWKELEDSGRKQPALHVCAKRSRDMRPLRLEKFKWGRRTPALHVGVAAESRNIRISEGRRPKES